MVNLDILFETFLKEKRYLQGVSPATVRLYSKSLLAFRRHNGEVSEAGAKAFMLAMLTAQVKPGTANAYARCMNSFLTWLHANEHTAKRFRIPLTKEAHQPLKTYTEQDMARIVAHKPRSRSGKRLMALLYLLIDTGARVSEALSVTRKAVDFESLLVTLHGKGGKQRRVPISFECRKRLFQWLSTHEFELVFCTEAGGKLRYDNVRRDFLKLLKAAKVEKCVGSFHAFRRFFGKSYLKSGGNAVYLQRLFGHSSMEMTKRYVEEDAEDLREAHRRLSPLEGLKKR